MIELEELFGTSLRNEDDRVSDDEACGWRLDSAARAGGSASDRSKRSQDSDKIHLPILQAASGLSSFLSAHPPFSPRSPFRTSIAHR